MLITKLLLERGLSSSKTLQKQLFKMESNWQYILQLLDKNVSNLCANLIQNPNSSLKQTFNFHSFLNLLQYIKSRRQRVKDKSLLGILEQKYIFVFQLRTSNPIPMWNLLKCRYVVEKLIILSYLSFWGSNRIKSRSDPIHLV